MLSDIAYRDYAVLLVCLDAEWTRQTFNSEDWAAPFANVFEEFTTNLWRYRGGMADYRKRIQNVVESHEVQPSNDVPEPNGAAAATDPPDPRLFNSVCYVPFGHSDGLGVVLIDDCEVTHHLAETTTTTVESLSLAFCPELKSLGVASDDPLFCDLEQMLGESPNDVKTPECTNVEEVDRVRREAEGEGEPPETWRVSKYRPAQHEFETAMPLLAFSTFKLDGLGTVGPGVLFQQAVFRAMIRKIRDVVSGLRAELEKPEKTSTHGLMSFDDLEHTRCALLDLQCAQEVGTLIFCPNATVAASILSGLRGLTYQDLLVENADVGGHLKKYLDESPVHEMIWRHSESSRKSETIPWKNLSVPQRGKKTFFFCCD